MHFNVYILFLPALFAMSGILAQETGEPTSATPDITYPAGDAFVFCSDQDCAGTCQLVDGNTLLSEEEYGQSNDMAFLSIYWYDPDNEPWDLYTSYNYYASGDSVAVGPNTCYNLYLNGIPTGYYYYWFDPA